MEDASEIASIAQQAYEISSDAYEMARQALEQQHYTANQIRVLEVQVTDMGEKLRTVQSLAGQTLRDSTEAYNQALNIYQQVRMTIPNSFGFKTDFYSRIKKVLYNYRPFKNKTTPMSQSYLSWQGS